ncbi:GNAT family N-acetyltransferase [Vibrio panuliri]|uniref:GNAT family N-acetyltransferase n=1 Tax=Vibrio panuliri TaxID=1381081 RepID=A0A1Q9HLZ8_9VIBR|nr:GNAT family N-acetyltransferase [Vibrio panuliri]OLQ91698.1 GNAT family N-acetyltransferase [Vibrio panuliri]
MTIATRRVLLVPYNESLLSDFVVLNCCVKNRANMNGPYTVSKAREVFERILNDNTVYARAVLDNLTREYIGHVAITDIHTSPELVFILDKAYWGKGIASEALGAFYAKALRDLKLHTVKATANVDHFASIRVLEKLGFVKKGLNSDAYGPFFEYQFTSDEEVNESALFETLS